jgi:hypothetical protein
MLMDVLSHIRSMVIEVLDISKFQQDTYYHHTAYNSPACTVFVDSVFLGLYYF